MTPEPQDGARVQPCISLENYQVPIVIHGANADDHIFKQIASTGAFYEEELLEGTRQLVRAGDFVVDVGANLGNHTLFWALVCGARVLALEPVKKSFAVLRQNIRANELEDRVFPRRYAAGRSRGSAVAATVESSNLGAASLNESDDGDIIVRPIDEVPEVRRNPVRLVKIDVEGMEFPVLEGMSETLASSRPAVLVECLDDPSFHRVERHLRGFNYAMVEAFNVSPTYLFLPEDWDYGEGYSAERHRQAVLARVSRLAVINRASLRHIRRMVGRLAMQDRPSGGAAS